MCAYTVLINQVLLLLDACRREKNLGWIAASPLNIKRLLVFLDEHEHQATIVYAERREQAVHIEFVELAMRECFALLEQKGNGHLFEIERNRARWDVIIEGIDRRRAENSISEYLELKKSVKFWTAWLKNNTYFLPDRLPSSEDNSSQLIVQHFSKWYYQGLSLYVEMLRYKRKLHTIKYSIPSAKFNDRYPMQPSILQSGEGLVAELALCDLCHETCICFLQCGVCKDKVLCYACLRNIAWSYQHDEHTFFSTWHTVYCPFCRSDVSDCPVLFNHWKSVGEKSPVVMDNLPGSGKTDIVIE